MAGSSIGKWCLIAAAVTLAACSGDTGTDTPLSVDRFHLWSGRMLTPMVMHPPLHERGVSNLAIIYNAERIMDFEHVGWFTIGSEHVQVASDPLIDPMFGETLLLELARDKAVVNVENYTRTHRAVADDWKQSFWTLSYNFGDNARALFADLSKKGMDGVLVIMEGPLTDFDGATVLGASKGLYSSSSLFVYAGFLAVLVDPATGKTMRQGRYQQVSATYLPGLAWKEGGFASYSPEEQVLIVEEIKERMRTNIEQILLLFKIIPKKDGEFMVVDDLDESEVMVFEYPE